METPEIAGFRHLGEVIAMNARLSHMIDHGIRQDDPREQLDFIQSCFDAADKNVIRISPDDRRVLNGLIKALRQELEDEFHTFATKIQMAIDMA